MEIFLPSSRQRRQHTIDYLLTAKRDTKAAKRFFTKAIKTNGQPELVNVDKSGSNKAALNRINEEMEEQIEIRSVQVFE